MKKTPWFTALMLSCALVLTPTLSDAKRLGGGKSSGLQRSMPARTAPDAAPAKPAQPAQQAQPGTPAQAAAPAAAPAKRSWLGPIAGIAAGLGLAALMSHLGLSEAFGSVLLMMLLAVAGVFLVRWLMGRMRPQPAGMARSPLSSAPAQVAWPTPASAPSPAAAPARPAAAFVPAAFDSEGFARAAKTIFVRLQAANDAGDLDDLRRFTTPEMFAELKTELLERAGKPQQTEVLHVDATVLDVADEDGRQVVSVRYTGRVKEERAGEALDFDEVWHLVRPHGDETRGWAIAGIEQLSPAT